MRHPDRQIGITLLELIVTSTLLAVITSTFVPLFVSSTRAISSLGTRSHITAWGHLVLDRVRKEIVTARLSSLDPAVPNDSPWIRFQKPVDFQDGAAVDGDPIQIELVPVPGSADEGIRIWRDAPPYGGTPGSEDQASVITGSIAPDGLKFTRVGAVLHVEITFRANTGGGGAPYSFTTSFAVKLRNGN